MVDVEILILKKDKILRLLPKLFLAFSIALIFLTRLDVWDSVILQYAESTNNWIGWHNFLDESGWEIYLPLYQIMKSLGAVFSAGYFFGFKILLSLTYVWLYGEIKLFMRKLNEHEKTTNLALILIFSSQILSASFGTPMTMHFLSIPMAFAAIRLYEKQNYLLKVLAIVLMLLAFTVNTWLLLIPSWVVMNSIFLKRRPPIHYLFPASLAALFYLQQNLLNPKYGFYKTYNNPFNILGSTNFEPAIKAMAWFFILALPALFLTLVVGWKALKSINIQITLSLAALSALPYIVVGKSPIFFESWDWSGRHGFIFITFLSIAVSQIASTGPKQYQNHNLNLFLKRSLKIFVASLVVFQSFFLFIGFQIRDQRMVIESRLISVLERYSQDIPEGQVQIVGKNFPLMGFSGYESNWIMYQATGDSKWVTEIVTKPTSFNSDTNWTRDPEYSARGLYSGSNLACKTRLFFEARGYFSRSELLGTFHTLLFSKKSISLQKIEHSCNG